MGLNLRSETDGRIVHMHFVPRPEHIGFAKTVHGGIVATVLDEVMVWACAVQTKRFAFCAELNVRYLRPVQPNAPALAVAELVANRRGRLFEAKAEWRAQSGQVLAAATGKYLPIKEGDATELTSDFVGDPRWALD
jgi:uncharacterized protein (TIGR00369 family)